MGLSGRRTALRWVAGMTAGACTGLAVGAPAPVAPPTSMEVLHWWSSAGERLALGHLLDAVNSETELWRNSTIPGGASSAAGTVLRTRLLSGTPPDLVHVPPSYLPELAEGGFLVDVFGDGLASEVHRTLLPLVASRTRVKDRWLGIPLGVHRVNTLVYHAGLWERLKLPIPQTWDAIELAADALTREGIAPMVWSDEGAQLLTLFDNLLLSELGGDGYVQLTQPGGWEQEGVRSALVRLHQLRQLVPPDRRLVVDWPRAGREFLLGRAGMWLCPDWCRGELNAWGMREGRDYRLITVPDTQGHFLYHLDCLAALDTRPARVELVWEMANVLLSPGVQALYNQAKGSTPVLTPARLSGEPDTPMHWQALSERNSKKLPGLSSRLRLHGLRAHALGQMLQSYVFQNEQGELAIWRQMTRLMRRGVA